MAFTKLVSFTKKVADLADKPALTSAQLKAQFDAAPDEVRTFLNNLIDALKSTSSGDSGAKNVGATAISGLTGTDVQSLLESLNTLSAKKAQDSWTNIVYQNSWTTLDSTPLAYFKDQFGLVHVGGSITGGATANGTIVGNLPVGNRPQYKQHFVVPCFVNGTTWAPCEITVDTNGNIAINQAVNAWYIHLYLPPFRAV